MEQNAALVGNLERKLRHLRRDISKLGLAQAGQQALTQVEEVVPFQTILEEGEEYLKEFLSVWHERADLQCTIEDDTFPSEQWLTTYDEVRSEIRQARITMATIDHRQHQQVAPAEATDAAHILNSSMVVRNNLPKISIPKFSGDLLSWRHFKDIFESIVHNEPSLTEIEKFHYLLSAVSGDAATVISGFPVEKESYQQAWDKLLATFNNERVLAKLYIQRILDSSVKGTKDDEKRYSTFLSTVAESIENFNRLNSKKPEEYILSILALRTLDEDTRRRFELTRTSVEQFPTATEVIDFVTRRMTALKLAKDPTSSTDNSSPTKMRPNVRSFPDRYSRRYNAVSFHTTVENSGNSPLEESRADTVKQTSRKTSRRMPGSPRPRPTGETAKRPETCPFCRCAHILSQCTKFLEVGLQDRIAFVKGWKGCPNCLRENHTLSSCNSKWTCRYCKQKHHSLVHQDQPFTPHYNAKSDVAISPAQSRDTKAPESFIGFGSTPDTPKDSVILLGTIQVLIKSRDRSFPVRAVLDSGSQHTFITKSLADRLGDRVSPFRTHVTGLGGAPVSQPIGIIDCELKSFNNSADIPIKAVIVNSISPLLPSVTVDEIKVKRFSHADLADHSFNIPGPIDLLIGMDIYPRIVKGAPDHTGVDELFLLPTVFGLVVMGSVAGCNGDPGTVAFLTESCEEISSNLKAFWELEEPEMVNQQHPDDLFCEQHFVQTHSRDSAGRYIVRLPLKQDSSELPNNHDLALKRFSNIERKMERDATLSCKYREFMDEYKDLEHMSLAHSSSPYIIPHHGVWQQRPEGPKLRVVFDASCGDLSLNDILLPGPKLQLDISKVLVNFRTYAIPLCTDIVKMYRQILVHPEERHLQHIYWRKSPSEALQEYELNTVTYGVRPSAFLAIRVVQQLIQDEGSQYPLAADRVGSSMYVDDIVTGANTMEEALELKRQLIALFGKGGFKLSKWASTVKELLPEGTDQADPMPIDEQDTNHQKILGLIWRPSDDHFSFTIRTPPSDYVTKRIILSAVARIFDPLGLVAPITFQAKVLLQSIWKIHAEWDESLPDEIVRAWRLTVSEWHNIPNIRIPRYFNNYRATIRIIGFCDASEKGYAANVYLRAEAPDGTVKTSLIMAKTKVAPLKFVSIARLELCGALLLTKLLTRLNPSTLTNDAPICFTDSTVVISWLHKPKYELKVFEANRVAQILSTVPVANWHHVKSEDNPADIGSRGCSPSELCESNLWWNGPCWISQPCVDWLSDKLNDEPQTGCMMAVGVQQDKHPSNTDDSWMERFSSYRTLVRTVARILRLRARDKSGLDSPISAEEFRAAQFRCVRLVQRQHLPNEMFKNLPTPKPYDQLHPFIDELGIVRVGRRLNNAPIKACSRHPMLIPRNCHLAQLIVDDLHQRHFHAGPTLVLALLRQEYWLLGAMKFIRGRVLRCVPCRIVRGKPTQPIMAPLPSERFLQFRAFTQTGLDYAGPFTIKECTRRNASLAKAYLCIFVCMASKAVHLEVASSLSTAAFLAALDRFVARRGLPEGIHSDHGSNFIGASRFIKDVYQFIFKNEPSIVEHLSPKNVNWRFIPPGTPHFGGLWEAGVKSVKTLLVQSIGKHPYTFEELATALTKIEGLLNSRPISALTEDAHDCEYLTPGHFLIGSSLSQIPDSVKNPTPKTGASRWQALRNQISNIWNRWRTQYLHSLQQRKKWTRNVPDLKPGDLVILIEKRTMLGHWPVARIDKKHPGKDGITRVVTVRTPSGLKVCLLGAMGQIGQPLSLLLKQSPWFDEAALYDNKGVKGLALELSQVDTPCSVTAHDTIKTALKGSQIVLNSVGVGGKTGMSKEDVFSMNAKAVMDLAREAAKHCPKAFHVIITNPVNSMVPLVSEVYKKMNGCVEPSRIFGLTSVDALRACALVADLTQSPPEKVKVPVVGGHSTNTMVPLLSKAQPCLSLTTDETVRLTRAVQTANDEIGKGKEGKGGPVLSVAHSALQMAESLARALLGERGVVECSYVMSNLIPDVTYFASPLELGPAGVQKILPLPGPLSNYECCLIESAIDFLKADIDKGVKYLLA